MHEELQGQLHVQAKKSERLSYLSCRGAFDAAAALRAAELLLRG